MATNSILRSINIKEKHAARMFVYALENAKGKKSKEVTISKKVVYPDKGQIASIFKK